MPILLEDQGLSSEIPISLDDLWDQLLSRHPETIRAAFSQIDKQQQTNVLLHLQRMATEEGWHSEQRASARAALEALKSK